MHHVLQEAALFIERQVYFQRMLVEGVWPSPLLCVIIWWSGCEVQGCGWAYQQMCVLNAKGLPFALRPGLELQPAASWWWGEAVSEQWVCRAGQRFGSVLYGSDVCVCVCVHVQNAGTVCRTATGTSPLLASQTDTRPTCTASGESRSRPGKRYEHVQGTPNQVWAPWKQGALTAYT